MQRQHPVVLQRLLAAQRAQAAPVETVGVLDVHLERVDDADLSTETRQQQDAFKVRSVPVRYIDRNPQRC